MKRFSIGILSGVFMFGLTTSVAVVRQDGVKQEGKPATKHGVVAEVKQQQPVTAPQATTMTLEETAVRQAYAKLTYAVQLAVVHNALKSGNLTRAKLESLLEKDDLHFELSSFSTGSIKDIEKVSVDQFVSPPSGEDVLEITTRDLRFTEDLKDQREVRQTQESNARVSWKPGAQVPSDLWGAPVGQVFSKIENGQWYSRYAAFTVQVRFHSRSRTYKAMFLFGKDESEVEQLIAADNVTGNSALYNFARTSVYPSSLLDAKLAANSVAFDWIVSNQVSDVACQSGKHEVCCDPVTLKCGVAAGDVNAARNKPSTDGAQRFLDSLVPQNVGVRSRNQKNAGLRQVVWHPRTSGAVREADYLVADCPDYNYELNPIPATGNGWGYDEHSTGGHHWVGVVGGSCEYEGPTGNCSATARAYPVFNIIEDEGGLYNPLYGHVTGHNEVEGAASGTAPSATAAVAAAVKSCLLGIFCQGVTISFSGSGASISAVFPTDTIFQKQFNYTNTCASHNNSPIIIDTTDKGFQLTSMEGGVTFDIRGDGQPVHIAWTNGASGNAFLALDRNRNGKIDNGRELFGNYTDQPNSNDRNGFRALAVFDSLAAGGNEDGVIDEHDQVWEQLRLWIDENHDGVSQADELHRLGDLGVHSLGFDYKESRRYDEYGNLFRYKSVVNPGNHTKHEKVNHIMFDVFFAGGQ